MTEALDDRGLDQLFREAHTAYGYLDRPVGEETLRAIWDLARLGPTSVNSQPLRVVWCVSDAAKEKLAGFASDKNADRVRRAPVAAIVAHDLAFFEQLRRLFPPADARSWFVGNPALAEENAFRNGSLGAAYLIVAARALGLATGPMSGFDKDGVDRAFLAGTSWRTNLLMTLGYADPAHVRPRLPRLAFDEATLLA